MQAKPRIMLNPRAEMRKSTSQRQAPWRLAIILVASSLSLQTINCLAGEMLSQPPQTHPMGAPAAQLIDLSAQLAAKKQQQASLSMQMAQQQASMPSLAHQSAQQAQQSPQMSATHSNNQISSQQPKLPNMNLYMKKQEVFKLLGINKEISYVTNGSINHYAIGFSIPMGYNQSDMIFTWQNWGPTNVNYSISLVIGNVQAFDAPLINITRSGLIPKQEQVFKITLPCSGKVSDEVDVQVLIQISGLVMPGDETANNRLQQQDFAQLMGGLQPTINSTNSSPEMQSDDPQMGRLVAHTLAIKRRKICAQHLVQVMPKPPIHPPWTPSSYGPAPQSSVMDNNQQVENNNNKRPPATDIPEKGQAPMNPTNKGPKLDNPPQSQPPPNNQIEQTELDRKSLEQRNIIASRTVHSLLGNGPMMQPSSNRIDDLPATSPYMSWSSTSANRLYNSVLPPSPSPIPPENPLNDVLLSNGNLIAGRQQVAPPHAQAASQSPLLLSLIGLSLFVSVALIVVALLGSSHSRPMEKLGGLTGCISKSTSVTRATNKCKSPMASAVISSLRSANQKLGKQATIGLGSAGLASAGGHSPNLRPISVGCQQAFGLSSKAQADYCFKQTNYSPGAGYYTTNQYQQHHYQAPPSADLLGANYLNHIQHQQQQQAQHPPICHIATGGNSQTTRLIWNTGNGTSPDGFTIDASYMPLSNAPHSDSGGSVYQSIY